MTPTRAARQADTTCAELDQLAALLFGGPTVKDPRAHYANLRRQIHAAISRDNITAGIDGYRSRHGSTDSGGNSDSTPVEAAALRLVEGGQPADIVSLDLDHPSFAGTDDATLLDRWIFAGGAGTIDCVWRAGVKWVEGGRHVDRAAIAAAYRKSVARIVA